MKILTKLFVLLITTCLCIRVNAQELTVKKPSLFNNNTPAFQTSLQALDKALSYKAGSDIQLNFGQGFSFTGTVISSTKKYDKLSTIIVKLPSLHNSILSITKRINNDNSVAYVGRIVNQQYADAYILKQNNDGNYVFQQIRSDELIQDF